MKSIGFVGFSGRKFDIDKAQRLVSEAFDHIKEAFPNEELRAVSGLTDLGIPALVYREAASRGWKTMGVACAKASDDDCYPCDERIIIGDDWGDESSTFLEMCDVFIRIGGGDQSYKEMEMAREMGLPIYQYELKAIE